jgi:hypothetical protein
MPGKAPGLKTIETIVPPVKGYLNIPPIKDRKASQRAR